MTTTSNDELKARLAAICWPKSLARISDARFGTTMTPYASISEHLGIAQGKSYVQVGDEVTSSLEDQGWIVTQRDQYVEVEGNVIPPRYVPEELRATSNGDRLLVTVGWPNAREVVAFLYR